MSRLIAIAVFYAHGGFFRGEVVDMHTGAGVTCKHRHRTELQATDCANDFLGELQQEAAPSPGVDSQGSARGSAGGLRQESVAGSRA